MGKNMTIGASIVHFVIKAPKLVHMIVTKYRLQCYKEPIVNPRWPTKIQAGRHKIQFFGHSHLNSLKNCSIDQILFSICSGHSNLVCRSLSPTAF